MPLIDKLHDKGYHVTVVDPYSNSAGVKIADAHIQKDVREKEAIWAAVKEMPKFDVVTTDQSDVSVETVAYVGERLGVPCNKEMVVEKFANKYLSRQYAQSVGVPVPAYTAVKTVEEMEAFIHKVGVPLIIKPCDAQSSKGIHKIEVNVTRAELEEYLADALQYSFVKTAILEQFVEGVEVTVEGFCANGKHRVMAMSRKKHFKMGIASALTYHANLAKHVEDAIIAADDRYVEQSGMEFGPTHAEYIVNEQTGEFWLVEIASRGGGTRISSDIVKWVSGFDVYEALVTCLEGRENEIDVKQVQPLHRSAELHFFDFGDGVIKHVEGVEAVKAMLGVAYADLDVLQEGIELHSCKDDRSRQCFVIVFAENAEELKNKLNAIYQTLKVTMK